MICFKNVNKTYLIKENGKKKRLHAVKDMSFDILDGKITGCLGPNGAGKSTTIKMMCGILQPDNGEILINGYCPNKNRKKYVRQIGAVFGQRTSLWWDLPAKDSFELLKKVYHVSDKTYSSNIEIFSDILNINELLNKPIRQMSLGQRMRCEVAAAFLHNPSVVFLDEPTLGLDLITKENIRSMICRLNMEKKISIILTTHDIEDIQELCKDVIIIDKGKKIYDGELEQLYQSYKKKDLKDILKDIYLHKTESKG